jgi:hypothetical protein
MTSRQHGYRDVTIHGLRRPDHPARGLSGPGRSERVANLHGCVGCAGPGGHGPAFVLADRSQLVHRYVLSTVRDAVATLVSVSLGDHRQGSARRQCYLPGCNRVTFSGLSFTLASAASTASANPGTDCLSRARNSWTALSMISWNVRASVKAIACRSCRLVAAVARYPIGSAGSARGCVRDGVALRPARLHPLDRSTARLNM